MSEKQTPKELFFTIGGHFGDSFQVNWQDGQLWYLRRSDAGIVDRQAVDPSAEEWAEFWRQLSAINAWRWREQYVDMSVRDGTMWALDVKVEDRELSSSGQNAYPPKGRGPGMTRDFRRFLQALSRLLGGQPLY